VDVHEHIEDLVPALRLLHQEGDLHHGLQLVEAIADLVGGAPTLRTAAALLDIGDELHAEAAVEALVCLGRARLLFDLEESGHGIALCDLVAAEIFAATGREEEAAELYERGLDLLQPERDADWAGRAWHNFGILLHRLSRPGEALDAHTEALEAYRTTGRATPTADCHVGIGMALHALDRGDEALEPYAAARALYTEFDEEVLLADVDDRRGLVLCDLGRYEEAIAAHEAAIARYDALGHDWSAARSRRYLSHPLDHAGRHQEALTVLETARAVFAEALDEAEIARCDASTAAALLGLGQEVAARPLLDSARRALAELSLEHESDWCARLLDDPASLPHRHP
jgi:tetratricopeptide (TPR) repeat protein